MLRAIPGKQPVRGHRSLLSHDLRSVRCVPSPTSQRYNHRNMPGVRLTSLQIEHASTLGLFTGSELARERGKNMVWITMVPAPKVAALHVLPKANVLLADHVPLTAKCDQDDRDA